MIFGALCETKNVMGNVKMNSKIDGIWRSDEDDADLA